MAETLRQRIVQAVDKMIRNGGYTAEAHCALLDALDELDAMAERDALLRKSLARFFGRSARATSFEPQQVLNAIADLQEEANAAINK